MILDRQSRLMFTLLTTLGLDEDLGDPDQFPCQGKQNAGIEVVGFTAAPIVQTRFAPARCLTTHLS